MDHGPRGIRVHAVALGSIATHRYQAFLASQPPGTATWVQDQMRTLHLSAAWAYLLSVHASFVNGAVLLVDGGRSAMGPDPEQA